MPEHMAAVVNHGPGDYRLEEVPRPHASRGEIVIEVRAAGICGSDAKCYAGSEMFWGGAQPWVKAPVIPGHEFFGTVVEVGEGAHATHGVVPGNLVIAEQIYPCDTCRYCRHGHYWMCQVHDIYGFQRGVADGAWATHMRFGAHSRVHRMPDGMPLEAGVLVEPLACALHGVERAEVRLDDVVVLAGAGPIGLLMLSVLRRKSPAMIVVTDRNEQRLKVARQLGADLTVNVDQDDPVEVVHEHTEGYGCDLFIEATGHPDAVLQGLKAIRKLGRMVVFGVFGKPVTVDWSIIGDRKELDIRGAHLGPYCYPTAIDWLHEGVVDASALVTHRLALGNFDRGLELVAAGEAIKVMLDPAQGGA
jgi:L-iditol 2-dehydrogenase